MTQSKFTRILNDFLAKLGDVEVVKFIDYYYRESYEGAMGWKVRKVMKLSDLIEANITPTTEIGVNWSGRDLIKFLEHYEKPFEVNVRYNDSYERYKAQNEANKDKELAKQKAFEKYVGIFTPYYLFRNPFKDKML